MYISVLRFRNTNRKTGLEFGSLAEKSGAIEMNAAP
ncbi:hypothetical protein SLEP1_g45766 [Rubroshorea leprosula]|uniref:Uncharacterized protein n=1 Tax=Rubroshorea leprosula TaxID=152421 RepID=A0AAV5LK39_9ROSI|nr:hypothetical protein SLEP1_g45766 [Rubroshorea leprosula]